MTLDYAHRHHLVHRDIKPEHCLYTKAGAFRLADWGLALHLGPKGEPQPMPVVGTLDYLAPEVCWCVWVWVWGWGCGWCIVV